jgi:hypothetical protein
MADNNRMNIFIKQKSMTLNKTNIIELLGKRVDSLKPWEDELYVTGAEFELYSEFLHSKGCLKKMSEFQTLLLDGKKLVIQESFENN